MDELLDYVYRPLESPDHIRILELQPSHGSDGAPIRVHLHHRSLSESKDTYRAISYAWGDLDISIRRPIICNNAKITIAPTLYSALTRLRGTDRSQLLWADALCINQQTTPAALIERSQQVSIMGKIFSAASHVVVDLGDADARDEMLVRCLKKIELVSDEAWKRAFPYVQDMAAAHPQYSEYTKSLKSHEDHETEGHAPQDPSSFLPDPTGDLSFWQGFLDFVGRAWFYRLWVVQEFALAKKVQVMIGHHMHTESILHFAVPRVLDHYVYLTRATGVSVEDKFVLPKTRFFSAHFWKLLQIRCDTIHGHTSAASICELLSGTRHLECSNGRDRVYALLGLSSAAETIRVDYSEDLIRLSLRISLFLLILGHGLYVIYNCVGCLSSGPSWILKLDKREQDSFAELMGADGRVILALFQACGRTVPRLAPNFDSGSLLTNGLILDTVSDMSSALPEFGDKNSSNEDTGQWKLSTLDWIRRQETQQSPKDNEFSSRCWRAAIADMDNSGGMEYRRQTSKGLQSTAEAFSQLLDLCRDRSDVFEGETSLKVHSLWYESFQIHGNLSYAINRRLGITKTHALICLLPKNACLGDTICILYGCPIPHVLRKVNDYFRIVGCCYVDGMMDGQAFESGLWEPQDIVLR